MVEPPKNPVLRCLRCVAFGILCLLVHAAGSFAQQQSSPTLHRRSQSRALEEMDASVDSRGRTTLPEEVSGEYLLGKDGESIEIDLESNRLSGYLTRFGDSGSEQGTPLTFFFAVCRLKGNWLGFSTHKVHGVWFSFSGTIVRGTAMSRNQQGYYLLEGTLTLHNDVSQSQVQRRVSLPMAREYSNG